MSKSVLMPAAREIELIRVLNQSDIGSRSYKRALDELVLANRGLVHKLVQKFPIKNSNCGYDDLFQEGVAGLIHGIQKYEVERGYRLSTYVYRWIQAYISRYFQNQGKTIRIPVHLSTREMMAKKQVENLTEELGHTPTSTEIADAGIESFTHSNCVSLNQMITDNEELDALQGEDKTEVNDYVMECELLLEKLRADVSERDFNIFCYRYGILNVPEHTLDEISQYHGITRSRIHQVSNACFAKMSRYTYSQGI